MTEYNWGTSWRPKSAESADPNVVGRAIERVAAASPEGLCTAKAYVDEARAETSDIHSTLPWNDAEAAEEHRLHVARNIIRSIVVIAPNQTNEAPAFVNVKITSAPGATNQGYVPLARVMSDEDLHRQALSSALSAVRSLQRRYSTLSELVPVWETVDKLEAELGFDVEQEAA